MTMLRRRSGGNGSQVKNGGIDCIGIDDYRKFPDRVAFLPE